jgi:aminoglycoside 3-N-acetyltransferase
MKQAIRARQAQLRKAYIRAFHSFTPDDLIAALHSLGLQLGDAVVAHTSYASFDGFTGSAITAVQTIQRAVGANGNLLMPTMPFMGSAIEYARSGAITDLRKSPSLMGLLTELFRRQPGVVRSIHPTHPIAVSGPLAAWFTEGHQHAQTPCGRNSPFHRLLEADGKILFAGVSIRTMSFFHFIEERLEALMSESPFTTEWFDLLTRDAAGVLHKTRTRLYAPSMSARRDIPRLIEPLRHAGHWREVHVGRLRLILLRASDVMETAERLARSGIFCYRP